MTLTSSDGQTVQVSPTAITWTQGTATLAVTLYTARTVTLTAAAGNIRGTSGSITVNPVVVPPTTVVRIGRGSPYARGVVTFHTF